MRCVIIGSGDIKNYDYIKSKLREDDYIICADGGYDHAVKMGIEPDVVLGDFDSVKDANAIKDKIVYPTRKDFTDSELALKRAMDMGADEVIMLALTGDRLDHTLGNITMLTRYENCTVIDDNNEISLIKGKRTIKGRKGQTISLIPVMGDCEGITTEGLEYPLKNETLRYGECRGVSNIMTENKCVISVKKGMALVIKVEKV